MIRLSSPERARGSARAARAIGLCALLLVLGLGIPAMAQQSGGTKNPLSTLLNKASSPANPTPAAAPAAPAEISPPTAIPLPEVAARAEELSRLLRDIGSQLPTRDLLQDMKTTLDQRDEVLLAKKKEVDALLEGSPSALELREQETYWYVISNEGAATRRQLLDSANAAQSAAQQLSALQPQWQATLQENQSTPDLGPTLDVIRDSVKSVQATRTRAEEMLRVIVNLQVVAANQHQLALDVLNLLRKSREQLKGRVLQRDSLPLWQVFLRHQQGEPSDYFRNANARVIGIRSFARENTGILVSLAVFLALCLFAAYRLKVATRGIQAEGASQIQVLGIIQHWFALGLLLPLLVAFLMAPLAPLTLIGVTILLSFFSILVLLPPLIEPRFRVLLYWMVAVYVFNAVLAWVTLPAATRREVQFLGSSAAVVLFAYLLGRKQFSELHEEGGRRKLLIFAMRLAVSIMALAQLANLFGFYKLTQFLSVLCVYSTFIAIAVFTAVRVLSLLFLALVNTPAAENLAMVRLHREGIARWTPRVMQWAGVLLWLGVTLDLMQARDALNQRISDLLDFNIAGKASNITLGSVLAFFAILLGGFALSSALRFLLREEMLKRLHLKRGIPELLSTTLHYLILFLVFLFAVNAGGVSLNRFTVLTGALGVGVGFGLQNIINNFVSGLILQFERPIRINDVLDVDGITGTVTRIGIRSSTVQTFQGAEVIVPNANFISGKVINWTLSEAKRRLELPVGVAYGTNPKLVKELLERPAIQHADVLTEPAPEAFFIAFGDSALNFELRFWVMQDSNTVKVNSEVALEVMRLLDEAGIEIPFPQRDLHVRAVSPEAAASLLTHNGSQEAREFETEQRHKAVGER